MVAKASNNPEGTEATASYTPTHTGNSQAYYIEASSVTGATGDYTIDLERTITNPVDNPSFESDLSGNWQVYGNVSTPSGGATGGGSKHVKISNAYGNQSSLPALASALGLPSSEILNNQFKTQYNLTRGSAIYQDVYLEKGSVLRFSYKFDFTIN